MSTSGEVPDRTLAGREALEREVAALREERDRALAGRDALIREVLPLGREAAPSPRRGWGLLALLLVLALGAAVLLLLLQQRGAVLALTGEGRLSHRAGSARVEGNAPISSGQGGGASRVEGGGGPWPSRISVIPVRAVALLRRVALAPDGAHLALAGAAGEGAIYDLARDRVTVELIGHRGEIRDLAFSSDGERVVTGGADGTVRLWDRRTGRLLRLLRRAGPPVRALTVSRQGLVAVAAEAPEIALIPLAGGVARALRGHTDWVRALAFSDAGDRLVSGGHDTRILIWDLETAAVVRTLAGHRLWVTALAIAPGGRQLASAGMDPALLLWDLAAGRIDHRLRGHARHVTALAFDAAGGQLASASLDRSVRLWDARTGQPRALLADHRWMVHSVAFDRSGRFLLSASTDGTVRLWPWPLVLPAVAALLPAAGPGEVTLRNNTTGERLRLRLLGEGGAVLPGAGARLTAFLRSGPDDRVGPLDPALIQLLDEVARRFGRDREIFVISGYRSPHYNRLRTRQSRGVARESQHLEGKALDIRVSGVTIMALRDHLKRLRRGGVGFYPDSNFVHLDTGKVRAWSGD